MIDTDDNPDLFEKDRSVHEVTPHNTFRETKNESKIYTGFAMMEQAQQY